jgi:hypothetical protein
MDTGEIECTGCGSENAFDPADLMWSGSFNTAGTYYIIVERTGDKAGPGYYALSIEGDGVGFLAPAEAAPAAEEAAAPVEAAAVVAAEPVPAKGGTGPEDALSPTGEWMVLDVGQSIWFAFRYEGNGSGINAYMDVSPDAGTNFGIWTDDRIRLWALGEEVSPVGRGADNEFVCCDLSWAGSFAGPGVYYVKVEHGGAAPANFALRISGDDVWW